MLLSLLGLFDVYLVIRAVGLEAGVRLCAHDPGKFLFHIVLLPLALGNLIARYPRQMLHVVWQSSPVRLYMLLLGAGIALLSGYLALGDMRAGFERRTPWVSNIGDPEARELLLEKEKELRKSVGAGIEPTDAHDQYENRVKELVGAPVDSGDEPVRDFWKQSSFRAKWGGFLSWLGILFAGALLWTVALRFVLQLIPKEKRHGLDPQRWAEVIAGSTALISRWLICRAYSEWYGNFEHLVLEEYPPFLIALFGVAIVAGFVWVSGRSNPVITVSALISLIVAMAAAVGKFKQEWFAAAARFVSRLDGAYLAAFYFLLLFLFAGIGLVLFSMPPSSPSQDLDTGSGEDEDARSNNDRGS